MSLSPDTQRTLQQLIGDVRKVLIRLEKLGARDGRALDRQIEDALTECGPLSTYSLRKIVRRRASDIRATLNLLLEANRITRQPDGKWRLYE